ALQSEAAAQLLAVKNEDGVAALDRLRPGHPAALLVAAAVPDDHATLPGGALEVIVGHLVVLDLDREPFHRRVERGALRHRPGTHRAVAPEPQAEVVSGGGVLLDDEDASGDAAHGKLLVALDLDRLGRDLLDPCPARPLAEELEQRGDRLFGTLGVDADGA